MVFKLSDNNEEVVVAETGAPGASYDEFLACLPDNDCRYAVYNAEYSTEDGERAKFVFFLWYECPSLPLMFFSFSRYLFYWLPWDELCIP